MRIYEVTDDQNKTLWQGVLSELVDANPEVTEVISVGPGVRYGIRLENGERLYADPNQLRERGNSDLPRKVWLGDHLGPLQSTGCCEWCREQFLSRNRYVWVRGISRTFCSESCASQEKIEG